MPTLTPKIVSKSRKFISFKVILKQTLKYIKYKMLIIEISFFCQSTKF